MMPRAFDRIASPTPLTPCPFCGGKAEVVSIHHENADACKWYAEVICSKCTASVGQNPMYYRMTREESERSASEAWNRRITPAQIERPFVTTPTKANDEQPRTTNERNGHDYYTTASGQ